MSSVIHVITTIILSAIIRIATSQCWNLLYSGAGCLTNTIDWCGQTYTTLSQCTSACNTVGIGYDYASWSSYDISLGTSLCCCSTSACSIVNDIQYNTYRKGSCTTTTPAPTNTPQPTSPIPTKAPTTGTPTISPTTAMPTQMPTTATPTTSPTTEFALYSTEDINGPLLISATIFTALGFIISTAFLFIYRKKIKEDSSRGTIMETLKEMSLMDKGFVVLKIADVFTDFIFAIDILLKYENDIIIIFGWIAFLTGVIGMVLFGVKLLLMRKVLYRIGKLKQERAGLNVKVDEDKIKEIVLEIRGRNNLILFFDLLCASLEDCPQLCIILMISIYSGFESATALLDLAVTMLTLFWCPIAILVSYCGCSDDALKEDENDNSTGDIERTENVQMTTPETRKDTTQSTHSVQSGISNNDLPSGWRIAYTQDGRVYFQNEMTKETQWSHPGTTQHMYT